MQSRWRPSRPRRASRSQVGQRRIPAGHAERQARSPTTGVRGRRPGSLMLTRSAEIAPTPRAPRARSTVFLDGHAPVQRAPRPPRSPRPRRSRARGRPRVPPAPWPHREPPKAARSCRRTRSAAVLEHLLRDRHARARQRSCRAGELGGQPRPGHSTLIDEALNSSRRAERADPGYRHPATCYENRLPGFDRLDYGARVTLQLLDANLAHVTTVASQVVTQAAPLSHKRLSPAAAASTPRRPPPPQSPGARYCLNDPAYRP
jgi:hypothetical protein